MLGVGNQATLSLLNILQINICVSLGIRVPACLNEDPVNDSSSCAGVVHLLLIVTLG